MRFDSWSPGGIAHLTEIDNEDGALLIKRMQDVSPYLDRNAFLRNHVDWRGDRDPNLPDMRKVASIPNIILEDWLNKGWIKSIFFLDEDDEKRVVQLLNGDYKYLKTAPVTI